jgi:hypothetical protein
VAAGVGRGRAALRSQGPASLPRLSERQFARLGAEPAKGPASHGWENQRWTLGRIKTVIGRRFHLTYTIQGVRKPLMRNGLLPGSRPPGPGTRRRCRGRLDEGDQALRGRLAAVSGAWLVFKDEAGFSMTPPHAKTWSPVAAPRWCGSAAAPQYRSHLIDGCLAETGLTINP